jgi:hypothetical protein
MSLPSMQGKLWDDTEIQKLLNSIRKNKPIHEIALEHERTVGGINSRRKKIAVDYWFNNKLSIEEIQKFTRLTDIQIQEEIKKESWRISQKELNKETIIKKDYDITANETPKKINIIEVYNELTELRKDVKEVIQLLNSFKNKRPL